MDNDIQKLYDKAFQCWEDDDKTNAKTHIDEALKLASNACQKTVGRDLQSTGITRYGHSFR